jgi:acetyl esterase/lipase
MIRFARRLTALVIAGSSLAAGCSTHLGQVSESRPVDRDYAIERVIENIVYTPEDWPQALAGDLYLPARRGSLPVVLVVHGGGWANRSRDDMEDISRKLARHGYAVFNIGYRFAPRYTYPAQLHDTRQALRWLAANAHRYRFDSRRINTWGYSSGAHLAALVGGYDGADETDDLPPVNAVVAGGTPADLRKYDGSPIVMRFMGGDRHEMPARYAEASPAWHINAGDPPVFLYHGKLDFLVTVDQATDYYEALRAAGVDAELFLKSWRGHMSMFVFGGEAEDRAIAFLNRRNSTAAISSAARD